MILIRIIKIITIFTAFLAVGCQPLVFGIPQARFEQLTDEEREKLIGEYAIKYPEDFSESALGVDQSETAQKIAREEAVRMLRNNARTVVVPANVTNSTSCHWEWDSDGSGGHRVCVSGVSPLVTTTTTTVATPASNAPSVVIASSPSVVASPVVPVVSPATTTTSVVAPVPPTSATSSTTTSVVGPSTTAPAANTSTSSTTTTVVNPSASTATSGMRVGTN